MSKIVQEKFEVRSSESPREDGSHTWASDKSARTKKGTPGREDSHASSANVFYNSLPPGMDGEAQEQTDQRRFNESTAGNFARGHNAGDFTQELDTASLREGFARKRMLPTDDEYYHEHVDVFYRSVTDEDGNESFAERGNTLDRL